jgi:hypothetical protein
MNVRTTFAMTLLCVACASGFAPAADAATVTIQYQLIGGSVSGGVPPPLTVSGGSFSVTYQALGLNTLIPGPAILNSFVFQASGISSYGFLSTAISLALTAVANGTRTAAGQFLNSGTALLSGIAGLHCTGPFCGSYGYTASVPSFFTIYFTGQPGGLTLNGALGGGVGTFRLVGVSTTVGSLTFSAQEIDRTFVPEPERPWQTLTALSALGLLAWVRRSRRRGP